MPVVVTEGGKSYRLKGYHLGWVGYAVFGAFCGIFNMALVFHVIPWKAIENLYVAAVIYGFTGGVCFDLIFLWIRTKWFKNAYGSDVGDVEKKNVEIKRLLQENRKLRASNLKLRKLLGL